MTYPGSFRVPVQSHFRSRPYSRKGSPREPTSEVFANVIGFFGVPSDSPTSARARPRSSLSHSVSEYHSPPMSPSDMRQDEAAYLGRVETLEVMMDKMRTDHRATHSLLQEVLAKLNPVTPSISPQPPRCPSSASIPNPAGRNKNSLKPSFPPDFAGDRNTGKAFLTSCRTYMRLCPESFEDEPTKIIWAMSYMKTGHAGRLAT